MGIAELFLIAVGLAMDAFAVSVCKGLNMKKTNYRHALIIGLFFGGFQALMPLIGWALGSQFEKFIKPVDHWIAFVLLLFIGGKMIYEALTENESSPEGKSEKLNLKELTVLAIATSIDALAVGITLAFYKAEIFSSVTIIGIVTFALSFIGVSIGNKLGTKFKNKAEIAGGIILIIIGLKILLEDLGIINF